MIEPYECSECGALEVDDDSVQLRRNGRILCENCWDKIIDDCGEEDNE